MSLVAAKKDDETDHNYIHTTKDIDTEFVEGTLCEERQHNMIHLYESAKNHTNINEFIETEVSECMSKMKMDDKECNDVNKNNSMVDCTTIHGSEHYLVSDSRDDDEYKDAVLDAELQLFNVDEFIRNYKQNAKRKRG